MTTQPNADFLKKLTATFLVEAREHIQALGVGLLDLEKVSGRDAQLPLVETLFREAHSLKGAARAVNAGEIERLCQALEGVFSDAKSGKHALSAEALDRLHRNAAVLGTLVDGFGAGPTNAEGGAEAQGPGAECRDGKRPKSPQSSGCNPASAIRNESEDTVRIATSKLDAIFVQAEELLGVKLAQAERLSDLRALAGLVAERDQDGEHAEAVSRRVGDLVRALADDRRRFDTLADRLLEDIKKALMLPFTTILAGFPKVVHDLARDAGKEIEFAVHGADIEIDKRILERIKDPLLHLIRNGVDHGIELPAERARRGKTPRGSLTLTIAQAAGKVEVRVTDDGAGIDAAAITTGGRSWRWRARDRSDSSGRPRPTCSSRRRRGATRDA